jgi:DNA-binding IclR family transcriptional regulator
MALHWGAFGKAILAALPDEELAAFLGSTPLSAATPQTIIDPDRLREELRLIRERGYATSFGEVIEGNVGVGACICDRREQPLGCIGIGGPELRMRNLDLKEVGRELHEAARDISNILRLQSLAATGRET